MGGTHGFMHAEAEFDEATPSIDFFLGLTDSVMHGYDVETPRATVEYMLTVCAEEEDDEAIYIDNGKIRVVWVVCSNVCLKYMRN